MHTLTDRWFDDLSDVVLTRLDLWSDAKKRKELWGAGGATAIDELFKSRQAPAMGELYAGCL